MDTKAITDQNKFYNDFFDELANKKPKRSRNGFVPGDKVQCIDDASRYSEKFNPYIKRGLIYCVRAVKHTWCSVACGDTRRNKLKRNRMGVQGQTLPKG